MAATFHVRRQGARLLAVCAIGACPRDKRWAEPLVIGDFKPVRLLVDTGATTSVLRPGFLQPEAGGRARSVKYADDRTVRAVEFRAHLVLFEKDAATAIFTIPQMLMATEGGWMDDDDGVLGLDMLRRIDFENGRARVTLAHDDSLARSWGSDHLGRIGKSIGELHELISDTCGCERALRRACTL